MEKKNEKTDRLMVCPVFRAFCKGKLCIFWDNPDESDMKYIRSNCLLRLGIQNFMALVRGDYSLEE